jgi:predicted Zn-dependent protease with MMP-like domain
MATKSLHLSESQFDRIVHEAVARIPSTFRRHLDNIVISVQRRPDPEMLDELSIPPGETLFGLYWGVPLTERSLIEPPLYPDTIYLFQEPLEQVCTTAEELREEIAITVVHELAHALGMSDEELDDLGYG